jgi:isopenicillin-N N-acyltransferase-like protein
MVTEAGIIGKIGLNSFGVGVSLNAIKARGMSSNRLPVHLGLRLCLNQTTRAQAIEKLREVGIAAACTIVCADSTGGVAVECSHLGMKEISMDEKGRVFHSNHFLVQPHKGVVDKQEPKDTLFRVKRIEKLVDSVEGEVTIGTIAELFKDEEGLPTSICRATGGINMSATLFNIVSDLTDKRAFVTLGRPSEPDEKFWLGFRDGK